MYYSFHTKKNEQVYYSKILELHTRSPYTALYLADTYQFSILNLLGMPQQPKPGTEPDTFRSIRLTLSQLTNISSLGAHLHFNTHYSAYRFNVLFLWVFFLCFDDASVVLF